MNNSFNGEGSRGVGIFTVLPVTNKGADNLQSEHIYVVKTGLKTIRVNIGGVTIQEMEQAAQLISSTLRRFHS